MNFRKYHTYVNNILLSSCLPVCITVSFEILAYRNVRQIAYRVVPLVRRELDKQLTNMVLIQIISSSLFIAPYVISTVLPSVSAIRSDPHTLAKVNIALLINACIYYLYFAVSLYIRLD